MQALQEKNLIEIEIPEEFICPISHEMMEDPVFAADGHTYERQAIEQWFATGRCTSPMTGAVLSHVNLTPNHTMRSAINSFRERLPHMQQQRIKEHRERQSRKDFEVAVKLREEELARYHEQKSKGAVEDEKSEKSTIKVENKNIKDAETRAESSSSASFKSSVHSLANNLSPGIPRASFFSSTQSCAIQLPSLLSESLRNGYFHCKLSSKKLEVFYVNTVDFVTEKALGQEARVLFDELSQVLRNSEMVESVQSVATGSEGNILNVACGYESRAQWLFEDLNEVRVITNLNNGPNLKGQLKLVPQGQNIRISYEKKSDYLSEEEHTKKTSAILLELSSFLVKSGFNELHHCDYLKDSTVLLYTTQYTVDAQELAEFLNEALEARCEDLTLKPR
jgi:hypothetical protein